MARNRIVVVTDPATAEGFLLSGVDVESFVDPREARDEVGRLLKDDTTEILLVNDNFLDGADDRVKQHMKSSHPPVLISLPVMRTRGRASRASMQSAFREIDAALGRNEESAAFDTHEHHVTHHELEAKTCRVCGHLMEPGMRICYECGSIQRSVRAKGMHHTPSRTAACHLCGAQIPEYKTLCAKCAASKKNQVTEDKVAGAKVHAPEKASVVRALIESIVQFIRRVFQTKDKAA
jgi:vacuolar-type H+-ATPase subunit F/Vma7/RNA polymerase subunit RPABC4/transcription elongation factor Spt4